MTYVSIIIGLHRFAARARAFLNTHGNNALDRRVDNLMANCAKDAVALTVHESNAHAELSAAVEKVRQGRKSVQEEQVQIFKEADDARAALND